MIETTIEQLAGIDVTIVTDVVTAAAQPSAVIDVTVNSSCGAASIDVSQAAIGVAVVTPVQLVASVITPPVIEVIASIVAGGGGLAVDLVDLTARDSTNQDLIYIGRSQTDAKDPTLANWQIYRYDSEAAVFVALFANGSLAFDQAWNDRESLTYT